MCNCPADVTLETVPTKAYPGKSYPVCAVCANWLDACRCTGCGGVSPGWIGLNEVLGACCGELDGGEG